MIPGASAAGTLSCCLEGDTRDDDAVRPESAASGLQTLRWHKVVCQRRFRHSAGSYPNGFSSAVARVKRGSSPDLQHGIARIKLLSHLWDDPTPRAARIQIEAVCPSAVWVGRTRNSLPVHGATADVS